MGLDSAPARKHRCSGQSLNRIACSPHALGYTDQQRGCVSCGLLAMKQVSSFGVDPLDATFGAIVPDIKLAELSASDFSKLYDSWLEFGLLIFPGQFLSNEEQIAFAQRFGDLEFDLAAITNVDENGQVHFDPDDDLVKTLQGAMGWHCDSTFMPVQAKGAVFSAHIVPSSGGETGWSDMCSAYENLDKPTQKRVLDLSAYHSLWYSQSKMGHEPEVDSSYGFHDLDPPLRPLVKTHPETGRQSLVIGRHAYGIPGMDPAASEEFLQGLVDFACQPPRVYYHKWSPGDAVVWDNRRLLHQGRPWDMREPRVMYHARIAGDPKTEFAAHA